MAVSIGEIWSDIDHRFVQDALGNLRKVINVESVMTSIDNILKTSPGERVMLPEFGAGLKGLLFENMNDTMMNFLSKEINDTLSIWDDRLVVQEVQFFADPDANSVSIAISIAIKGQNKIYKYVLPIKGEL